MNFPSRSLAATLAAVLAVTPLSAPAQQFAAASRAAVSAPGAVAGAVKIQISPITPSIGSFQFAPSLGLGAPGAALSPALIASPGAAASVEARRSAAAIEAKSPAILPALAAKTAVPSALATLTAANDAVAAASKPEAAPDADKAALDALFTGEAAKNDSSFAVAGTLAAASSSDLDHPAPPQGPRWVKNIAPQPAAPKSSVKRVFAVGVLGATIPLALTMLVMTVAGWLGYAPTPNYEGPVVPEVLTWAAAASVAAGAAVMAPVSEEAIFRAGMQGTLAKILKRLPGGAFWIPAAIISTIFVLLHETSDPVFIATRFIHSMVIARVYYKEGLLSAMAAHGVLNGILMATMLLSATTMPLLAFLVTPAAIAASIWAARVMRAQKAQAQAGELVAKRLDSRLALALAALLMAGFFLIAPSVVWAAGAVALLIAALRKRG